MAWQLLLSGGTLPSLWDRARFPAAAPARATSQVREEKSCAGCQLTRGLSSEFLLDTLQLPSKRSLGSMKLFLGRCIGLPMSFLGFSSLTPHDCGGGGRRGRELLFLTDGWVLLPLEAVSTALLRLITGLLCPCLSQSLVQSVMTGTHHPHMVYLLFFGSSD